MDVKCLTSLKHFRYRGWKECSINEFKIFQEEIKKEEKECKEGLF